MSYSIQYTAKFKKSFKRCLKRGLNTDILKEVISILSTTGTLPEVYRPHKLSGKYAGVWECHIQPDWLLLWTQDNFELTLILLDTGTHSDLF